MRDRSGKKNILFFSACTLSVLLHGGALYFLIENPPMVRVVSTKLFPNTDHPFVAAADEASSEYQEKDDALEDAFAETVFMRKEDSLAESQEGFHMATPEKSENFSDNMFRDLLADHEGEDDFLDRVTAGTPKIMWEYLQEDEENVDSSEQMGLSTVVALLSQDRYEEHEIPKSEREALSHDEVGDTEILSKTNEVEEEVKNKLFPLSHELGIGTDFSFSMKELARAAIQNSKKPSLDFNPSYSTDLDRDAFFSDGAIKNLESYALPDIYVKTWEHQFDTLLSTFRGTDDQLYFSIELKNRSSYQEAPIASSFFFMIDLTTSHAHKEFSHHTHALIRSLKHLNKGDLFNVVLIGKKNQYLSPHMIPYNPKNLAFAAEFLEAAPICSGRVKDLLTGMQTTLEIIPEKPTSLCNIFLLTSDNEKPLSKEETSSLQKLLKSSRGKAVFFPVFAPSRHLNPIFEALSTTTGGRILNPPTLSSYPRKLSGLILDVKTALLKNLFIDAIPDDEKAKITLLPTASTFTHFYERKPLKILGKIDRPTSFTLRIRGMNTEELVTIEKKISLSGARLGSRLLEALFNEAERQEKFNHFALGQGEIPDKIALPSLRKARKL